MSLLHNPSGSVVPAQAGTQKPLECADEKCCCCGHYWMDLKKGERINNLRVKQAHDAGADTIVTGCAYCLHMLEDSVKLLNHDDTIRVIDLASLMLESLDEPRRNKVSSEDVKPQ